MNKRIGKLPIAVLIAALGALSAPFVGAAEPEPNGAMNHPPMQGGPRGDDHEHNRGEHAQKSLAQLQQQLHLKDNQQAAWTQYQSFILSTLKAHEDERGKHHQDDAAQPLSTPDRLQKMVAKMRERADSLEKLGNQTQTFYKVLSPEQKTILDLHWQHFHRGHRG